VIWSRTDSYVRVCDSGDKRFFYILATQVIDVTINRWKEGEEEKGIEKNVENLE
jgi:hypothetical protein